MTIAAGFIGLGIMGEPMARHVAKAGFELHVYNRTAHKAQRLQALGARRHDTPAALARHCHMVVVMVHDHNDVAEVLQGHNGAFAGLVAGGMVINMSTVSVHSDRAMAQEATAAGLRYLDAPVSGGDVGAKNGTLSIMVGGAAADFEAALPLLQAMGKTVTLCGPHGAGQATKLCNQIMVAVNLLGVCEALAFARLNQLDPATMLQAVGSGAAQSWQLQHMAPRIVRGDFDPGFRIRALRKDLAAVQASLDSCGASLRLTALATQMFEAAHDMGLDEMGTQAVSRLLDNL